MKENFYIKIFEGKQVRIVWDAEKEKYYFAVADIVEIVTESKDVKQYIKRMRARDPELNSKWGTICTPVEMVAPDGKRRKTQAADLERRIKASCCYQRLALIVKGIDVVCYPKSQSVS